MRWVWIPLVGATVAAAAAAAAVTAATRQSAGPELPPAAIAACGGFDFPVGPPDASGYYDAQPFGKNDHLGNDWNGNGGGDTDLGDPVHAIAAGVVSVASDHGGGWGNVVRVVHACGDVPGREVESLYAHLDTLEVQPGQRIDRGQRIGTIGTAGGQYRAHLHLELRARRGMELGGGYSKDTAGYLDPTAFILGHR
ncbi:MAG TPA: M23 family metallopeptidase [Kofleriaceae bacterium]|nr:M23 family metallopeptidase [Kofleriaceae bacterium]